MASNEDRISAADALASFAGEIGTKLPQFLPTEQDVWWFLAEQYDYFMQCDAGIQGLLQRGSIQMHEIEYAGSKSENSYIGKPNDGVAFLRSVREILAKKFGEDLADLTICEGFMRFTEVNVGPLNQIRLKYAKHFQNNCVGAGAQLNPIRWQLVIDEIGASSSSC